MAYKYTTATQSDGSYIEYDISPDLCASGAFTIADTITITGIVHNRLGKFSGLTLSLHGTRTKIIAGISFSSAKGSDKSFTFSFSAPDLSDCMSSSSRVGAFDLSFSTSATVTSGGVTATRSPSFSATNRITYVKYRLEPNILDFRLERCNSSGAADNEGTYLRCAMLKLSKSAQASASDYSVCRFSWTAASGASGSFSATGPFSQALTSTGYKETGSPSSNLFGTRQFLTTTDYNVTLTVGDAYDTYSATVVVPRAFAILHLSGAANGGVGVGMFSSATDDNPMFEVAENHQSIFYGPVEFRGSVSGVGMAGFTTVTLENTSSSARSVSGTIPTISGAKSYICTGVLGWNSGGRAGYATAPSISGNTLSASLAGNTTVMFGILGVR